MCTHCSLSAYDQKRQLVHACTCMYSSPLLGWAPRPLFCMGYFTQYCIPRRHAFRFAVLLIHPNNLKIQTYLTNYLSFFFLNHLQHFHKRRKLVLKQHGKYYLSLDEIWTLCWVFGPGTNTQMTEGHPVTKMNKNLPITRTYYCCTSKKPTY